MREFLAGFILCFVLISVSSGGALPQGDINNDGDINLLDLGIVTSLFGLTSSDVGWNATADVIPNGEIDIFDLVFVASRFT
jgi:hypothetical protein